jgi:diacylglycerol kinase (ATP)
MRALIVFNPAAGQAGQLRNELEGAAEVWRNAGRTVALAATPSAGAAQTIAAQAAADGYDVVIAAGGDGTINEVVNGLAGTAAALATLPLGTMNVWARELGLPLQPRQAAAELLKWPIRTIDLGRADQRYFLLMAGVGFDAAITAAIDAAAKRRFGAFAYIWHGIEQALRIRGTRVRITIDGRRVSGRILMVVIGNSQLYGGVVKITHRATLNDGLLDIAVYRGDSFGSALGHLWAILRRRYGPNPAIAYYRGREIAITARRPLPVQVDGDAIGTLPMRFSVAPGALRALLPPDVPDDLLAAHAPHSVDAR